jgi:predicted alpha/beta superfamily hydrolase
MKKFVEETQLPMIIAAVECNHRPNNGRLSEYSPFTFDNPKLGHIRGRGRTTMEWLVNHFKPYIDANFPTIPDREHTFIAGSSMGGLMSLYAVMTYNHVFSRAAALSPSLWFAPRQLDRMLCQSSIQPDTVVYMDYGSRELPFHNNMKQQFSKVAARLLERGVLLNCRIVPNGNHNEASWEQQIPFFIDTLLYEVE